MNEKELKARLKVCTPHQIAQLCDLLKLDYRLFEEYYINKNTIFGACFRYGCSDRTLAEKLKQSRKTILIAYEDKFYRKKLDKLLNIDS